MNCPSIICENARANLCTAQNTPLNEMGKCFTDCCPGGHVGFGNGAAPIGGERVEAPIFVDVNAGFPILRIGHTSVYPKLEDVPYRTLSPGLEIVILNHRVFQVIRSDDDACNVSVTMSTYFFVGPFAKSFFGHVGTSNGSPQMYLYAFFTRNTGEWSNQAFGRHERHHVRTTPFKTVINHKSERCHDGEFHPLQDILDGRC